MSFEQQMTPITELTHERNSIAIAAAIYGSSLFLEISSIPSRFNKDSGNQTEEFLGIDILMDDRHRYATLVEPLRQWELIRVYILSKTL